MFRQLKNNESGMVMIMALMVTIMMMVYSVGVVSRGTSQTKSVEEQIDSIKAEQLALGAYAKAYTDLASGAAMPGSINATMDNKSYTTTLVNSGSTGPDSTSTIVITSPYSN